jgi:hypothetical protein
MPMLRKTVKSELPEENVLRKITVDENAVSTGFLD